MRSELRKENRKEINVIFCYEFINHFLIKSLTSFLIKQIKYITIDILVL